MSHVYRIGLSSVLVFTPNGSFFSCASIAFSERYSAETSRAGLGPTQPPVKWVTAIFSGALKMGGAVSLLPLYVLHSVYRDRLAHYYYYYYYCGPGSSVRIATEYGLGGSGSNPGGDEIFRLSRAALGPTQPPVQWVPGISRG